MPRGRGGSAPGRTRHHRSDGETPESSDFPERKPGTLHPPARAWPGEQTSGCPAASASATGLIFLRRCIQRVRCREVTPEQAGEEVKQTPYDHGLRPVRPDGRVRPGSRTVACTVVDDAIARIPDLQLTCLLYPGENRYYDCIIKEPRWRNGNSAGARPGSRLPGVGFSVALGDQHLPTGFTTVHAFPAPLRRLLVRSSPRSHCCDDVSARPIRIHTASRRRGAPSRRDLRSIHQAGQRASIAFLPD